MRRRRPSVDQQAALLLRWYPAAWRDRYGPEFQELLVQDLAESTGSWWRSVGVMRSGLLARVRMVVPGAYRVDPTAQIRAGLAAVSLVGVVTLVLGSAMWSQLAVGWEWAAPVSPAVSGGLVGLSAGVALLFIWAAGRVAPAIRDAIRDQRQHRGVRRVSAFVAGVSVLVVAGRHFANFWPGTGGTHGHAWALLPGGVAAFMWACTQWISSYWAHPTALGTLPASQLTWMLLSPVALAWTILAALRLMTVRNVSRTVLRYEQRISVLALAGIVLVALGGLSWVVDGYSGPHDLFRAGALDGGLVSAAATGAAFALLAARGGRRAQSATPS